jgi:hypothetical protein
VVADQILARVLSTVPAPRHLTATDAAGADAVATGAVAWSDEQLASRALVAASAITDRITRPRSFRSWPAPPRWQ